MRLPWRVAGLDLTFSTSVLTGLFLALLGGLIAAVLHEFAEIFHRLGHATAARATGYPMIGIRFCWMLGSSVHPADEPHLAPALHIRRALGGPSASALLTLVALALWLLLRAAIPDWSWVGLVFFLDNLLFFTAGSFLPLGFTDGSTLLRWLPRRSRETVS